MVTNMSKLERALSAKMHKRAVAVMEEAIFGTDDVRQIASLLDSTINEYTAAHPVDLICYEASTGAVFGLELDNGELIVLKSFPPETNRAKLEAKRTVQRSLTDQNYPLTVPITGVFPFGSGLGVLDQHKEAPKAMETLIHDAVAAYARALVDFVQHASFLQKNPVMYEPFPSWPKERGVWGIKTRPGINLYDNPQGAEWIDDLGNRGLALADSPSGRILIIHGDWFPHNVRLDENMNLQAVFSWDAINVELETVAVGKACTLGTHDDAKLFIESYEEANNRWFTRDEMRTIAGVATWMRAFLARWSHSQGEKEAESDLQQALRRDGEKLFSLAS